jgi:ATP-binding protein involved in chromosome partitioning
MFATPSVTEAAVLAALRAVHEPDTDLGIVDLDMVGPVAIKRGEVRIPLAVLVADPGRREELTHRVVEAVGALDGVTSVDVELSSMSDEARAALRQKLEHGRSNGSSEGRPAPAAMGHAEGRPIPFSTAGSRTRVIGIASGKGGVGKSTVTVNLAVTLAALGHRVGLLDADVYGYSIPKMLGITTEPVQIDDMVIPPQGHGVRCMSVGFLVDSDETPVMWRGPMLHKILEEFLTRIYWDEPDYLIFDMPPGTGDVALSMHNYLPQAEMIVVTTPQPAAQRVAQRSASMAVKVNTPLLGVIENMSWFTGDDGRRYELFGSGGGQELATRLGIPLIGQIPLVPALREGGDTGVPISVADPGSEAAQAFAAIAGWLTSKGPKRRFRPELTVR